MLAASVEAMRDEVARLFESRVAASGPSSGRAPELDGTVAALLDDLCAALRRGRVETVELPADARASPQGEPPRSRGPELGLRELRLLAACIHDLIEQHALEVTPREMHILSDWLLTAAARHATENARLHRRLRDEEARFRVAIAHSNVTVFEADREGRHLWICNPQLGHAEADVLGKTHAEISPPDDDAQLRVLARPVLETGERVRGEVRLTGRDGGIHHMLVALEPLRNDSGAITGIAGATTDITDQKNAQEELAQALAFREQVMGILGHDLRNPLSAVGALVTLLQRRADLPEAARESLAEIDRAGKRMLEMIATLLDFTESRFTGRLSVVPVPTDLHELCRAVVDELRAAEPGRTIELDVEGDGRGAWDPARLAQVVSNLVGNALKHGERRAPVRVSIRGDGDEVVLRVVNHGPAIAPELIPALFEPFRRGAGPRDSSRARGLGLGLYIVRLIVTAHGGAIGVHSTAEHGTTFTVRLPRATDLRADEAQRIGRDGDGAAAAP